MWAFWTILHTVLVAQWVDDKSFLIEYTAWPNHNLNSSSTLLQFCPAVYGCLPKTNGATAALNIYSASAMLHLYLFVAYNNTEDNGALRAAGWGICWWGTKHFSLEIMNTELQDIHSFNLYLDSTRGKHRASSHFQVCPPCIVTKLCITSKMDIGI